MSDPVNAAKQNNDAVDALIKEGLEHSDNNDLIKRLVEQVDYLRGQPLYSQRALIVRQAKEIEELIKSLEDIEKKYEYLRRVSELECEIHYEEAPRVLHLLEKISGAINNYKSRIHSVGRTLRPEFEGYHINLKGEVTLPSKEGDLKDD